MSRAGGVSDESLEEQGALADILRRVARAPSVKPMGLAGAGESLAAGNVLAGKYEIERVLGRGGMGVVVAAHHLDLDQRVAIKLLLPEAALLPSAKARFSREGRLAAALRSEHCARVLDMGTLESGAPYLVMEYLSGDDFGALLEARGSIPVVEAVDLLMQAIEGIAEAHARGIVHRDLKPGNLFLTSAADGSPLVKVLDFGLSKAIARGPTEKRLTGTLDVAGTPHFMSPEQIHGLRDVDARTDVWALGVILYTMIGGDHPFEGDTVAEVTARILSDPPRPLRVILPDVPRALEAAIHGCLVKEVTGRVQSVAELARRIAPFGSPRARLSAERVARLLERPLAERTAPRAALGHPRAPLDDTSTPAPGAARMENRLCTILFAEVSRLPALAGTRDPEEVKELVDRTLRAITERIERAGGVVDKRGSGRVMAVFGMPRASDNDAERAVSVALDMQAILDGLPSSRGALSLRCGINTGRVLAEDLGSGSGVRSVFGDTVDLAERLHLHAPTGAVLLGHATYRNVMGRFDVEPLPVSTALGAPGSGVAYRVSGRTTARPPIAPSDFYELETKFIGRAAEQQRIADLLETTISESRAQIVTLLGPPGVGRSRMLGEIVTGLAERSTELFVMMAQGSPLGTDTSYGLAAALVRMRFQIHESDPQEIVADKLRRAVIPLRRVGSTPPAGGGLDEVLFEIATLLGARTIGAPGEIPLVDDGAHARSRISAAVARLLSLAAGRAPMVVVCDDVQWADDASLDLLDELVVRLGDRPLFVLCSARPELYERRPHWGEGRSAHARVDMAPLARRHIEAMARDRLRTIDALAPEFVKLLLDRADGYPLILQEVLYLLIDAGVIERRASGRWTLHDEGLQALALPTTIEEILQARVDRLDPDARAVLMHAAVIGCTFWEGAVHAVRQSLLPAEAAAPARGAAARDATRELLCRLRNRQLIRARETSTFPGEREYVFSESAIQEFAYKTLNQTIRRRSHRCVAAWLDLHAPGAAGAALVAVHYDRGGDARLAVQAYARAGAHAAVLGQNQEALRHLERACAICDERRAADGNAPRAASACADGVKEDDRVADWRDRVRLRLELGDVLRRMGELDRATREYEKARLGILRSEHRSAATLDPGEALRWEARIDFRTALTQWVRGAAGQARVLVERAIDTTLSAGAVEETPPMWAVLAALHRRGNDLESSRRAVTRGLKVCRSLTLRDDRWREHVSHLLGALGAVYYSLGRLAHAERCCRRAARVVDETTNLAAACIAQNTVAAVRYKRGDLAGARDTFAHALALKERLGDLHELVIAHNNLAEVELQRGDVAAALDHARQAVCFGERMHAASALADSYRNLADASFAAGDLSAAIDAGLQALARAELGDGRTYLGDVVMSLARICRSAIVEGAGERAVRARAGDAAQRLRGVLRAIGDGEHAAKVEECNQLLAGVVEPSGERS